jgi:hypothetical protein
MTRSILFVSGLAFAAEPAAPVATPAVPLAVFNDLDENGKLDEAEYTAWSDKQKKG